MLYSILRSVAIFVFKFIFGLKVFGRENIPQKGGFILVSNHSSFLDPIVLGVACPQKLNFMARHDLFFNPLFSRFISALGAFAIKRHSADLSALKEAMHRLKDGKVLVLFPEGTRKINGVSGDVQSGIGFLATKVNAPIIPVFIQGTERVLPKNAKFIRLHRICVYFGQKISLERRLPSYQDIAYAVMEEIRRLSCAKSG